MSAPFVFEDGYIERWGAIFLANPSLRRRGIRFDVFLQAPREILAAHVYADLNRWDELDTDEHGYLPLTYQQRRAAARVAAADSFRAIGQHMQAQLIAGIPVEQRGPHLVEPLHHHSYSVSRGLRRVREGGV